MQNPTEIKSSRSSAIRKPQEKRYDSKVFSVKEGTVDLLHMQLSQLERYTYALCHGELDVQIPSDDLAVTKNIAALHSQLLMTRELLRRAANGDYTGRLSSGMIYHAPVNALLERLDKLEQSRMIPIPSPAEHPDTDSMLLMVLESIEVIIVVVDKATRQVRFINQYACRSLNLQPYTCGTEQILKHPLIHLLVSYQGTTDATKQSARWEAYCSNPARWYSVSTSAIQSANGSSLFIHSAVDITEQKRNARRLENYAYLDPLTALPNRREGYAQLEYELGNQRNDVLSICFIDMDNLKLINDLHGHEEGDQALLLLTSSIRNCIRPRDHACRYAGDEFFIVFPRCDQERAVAIIERIRADVDRASQDAQKPYQVSFSYGVVQWTPDSQMDAKKLLEIADSKMYEAKKKKKAHLPPTHVWNT